MFIGRECEEIIIPSLWEQQTFIDKAGPDIIKQLYAFEDKKGRPICLIPEVTAIIQEIFKKSKQPRKLFYISRCYRYERPQKGRYREFTQFGVEFLNFKTDQKEEIISILKGCIESLGLTNWEFKDSVKRGLTYYIEDGFEVECPDLGAQKQIAGGGKYDSGIGFAIGIDRIILTKKDVQK